MFRVALEEDDFRFLVIWEFRVTGNWVASRLKGVASRLKVGL